MSIVDKVIAPRTARLGESLTVRRVLPFRERRMVGPFCFLDHMGPQDLPAGIQSDVPPHPHIGLSTVTYLFEGSLVHRDSLGSEQLIRPGDVNWMTAGRGIVHSERRAPEFPSPRLHGLQAWVALPLRDEQGPPGFEHQAAINLPVRALNGSRLTLIAGKLAGLKAPVRVHSELFYARLELEAGASFEFQPGQRESAFYLVDGEVQIENTTYREPTLVVFRPDTAPFLQTSRGALGMILGGEAFPEPRHIYWNFVASDKTLIERAKERWRKQLFEKIPGETEFVPLPDEGARP